MAAPKKEIKKDCFITFRIEKKLKAVWHQKFTKKERSKLLVTIIQKLVDFQ